MKSQYYPAEPGGLAALSNLTECHVCHRKILVSVGLVGVNHSTAPSVCCAECLTLKPEFLQQFPDFAKELQEWKNASPNPVAE